MSVSARRFLFFFFVFLFRCCRVGSEAGLKMRLEVGKQIGTFEVEKCVQGGK